MDVFPAPVGSVTVSAENRATGNAVTATVAVPAAGAKVDLDLALAIIGPAVQSSTPADGAAFVKADYEKWKAVITEGKIETN